MTQYYDISEAVRAAKVSRHTILKQMNAGKLSFKVDAQGKKKLLVADLRKVFNIADNMQEKLPAPSNSNMYGAISIGTEFFTESGKWRCTDKGTRTIIAIKLDQKDESCYNGPPYSVAESVFAEDALDGGVSFNKDE